MGVDFPIKFFGFFGIQDFTYFINFTDRCLQLRNGSLSIQCLSSNFIPFLLTFELEMNHSFWNMMKQVCKLVMRKLLVRCPLHVYWEDRGKEAEQFLRSVEWVIQISWTTFSTEIIPFMNCWPIYHTTTTHIYWYCICFPIFREHADI